jgi:hypothetical protein
MSGVVTVSERKGRRSAWRAAIVRSFAALLASVLVVASMSSGHTYLWCAPMERVVETCCMATTDDPSDLASTGDAPRLQTECCDTHAFGHLPTASASAPALEIPPAVMAAVAVVPVIDLPLLAARRAPPPAARSPRLDPIRAGPGSGLERLVALQVFRC